MPDADELERIGNEYAGIREQEMEEPRSDEHPEHEIQKEVVDVPALHPELRLVFLQRAVDEEHPKDIDETIPTDLEGSELQDDRIDEHG